MIPSRPQLHIREGWTEFVTSGTATAVEPLSPAQAKSMTAQAVADHTKQRVAYHSKIWVIETAQLRAILDSATELATLNSVSHGSPRGLIISGEPNVGKTTALTSVGMKLHLALADRPEASVPVMYVILPPRSSGKDLCQQVSRFLGLPYKDSDRPDKLLAAIRTTVSGLGTRVLLLDEVHNLSWGDAMAKTASDYLKFFSDTTGLTIVAAGVRATNTAMITQGRGNQIAGRYEAINIEPFGHKTKRQQQSWRSFIKEYESLLRLKNHSPGSLQDLSGYLFDRTQGYLGSLALLIQRASLRAITRGTERIDRELLDEIPLDHAAEQREAVQSQTRRQK